MDRLEDGHAQHMKRLEDGHAQRMERLIAEHARAEKQQTDMPSESPTLSPTNEPSNVPDVPIVSPEPSRSPTTDSLSTAPSDSPSKKPLDDIPTWEHFKLRFGRIYATEEDKMRREIYNKAVQRMREHNAKYEKNELFHRWCGANINAKFDRTGREMLMGCWYPKTLSESPTSQSPTNPVKEPAAAGPQTAGSKIPESKIPKQPDVTVDKIEQPYRQGPKAT